MGPEPLIALFAFIVILGCWLAFKSYQMKKTPPKKHKSGRNKKQAKKRR